MKPTLVALLAGGLLVSATPALAAPCSFSETYDQQAACLQEEREELIEDWHVEEQDRRLQDLELDAIRDRYSYEPQRW